METNNSNMFRKAHFGWQFPTSCHSVKHFRYFTDAILRVCARDPLYGASHIQARTAFPRNFSFNFLSQWFACHHLAHIFSRCFSCLRECRRECSGMSVAVVAAPLLVLPATISDSSVLTVIRKVFCRQSLCECAFLHSWLLITITNSSVFFTLFASPRRAMPCDSVSLH